MLHSHSCNYVENNKFTLNVIYAKLFVTFLSINCINPVSSTNRFVVDLLLALNGFVYVDYCHLFSLHREFFVLYRSFRFV